MILLFEMSNELQSWLEEPHFRREKVLMTAKVRSMLIVANHYVFILNNLVDWNALPVYNGIILGEVNESWHCNFKDMRST